MRRASSLCLILPSLFAGCAMPVDGAPGVDATDSPLRFELERGEDDLVTGVRLVNDGVEELRFGRADMGYAPMPKVLVEAQQEGGEYVGRGEWYAERGDERGAYESLPPGGELRFSAAYSAGDLRPGDYRVSADLYGTGDTTQRVSRELGRTGWPVELVEEALAIRREAEAESCMAVVRTLTYELLAGAGADGIAQMESGVQEPWAQAQVREEMLARGAFASELADFMRDAPLEDVEQLLESVSACGARVQAPVQRAANERLLELMQSPTAEFPPYYFSYLGKMSAHWSDDAPEVLMHRLEYGEDEEYALDGLVDLFVYEQQKFESVRPRVFRILRRRCAEVRSDDHRSRCHRALAAYDPTSRGRVGLGGMSTSCRCGGSIALDGSRCAPFHERWERLLASAPPPEDYAAPSRVELVAPEVEAAF